MARFTNMNNWVVVGDVTNESKYAYKILNRLEGAGYKVCGMNPKSEDEKIYKRLKDIPYDIEVIDLCIHPVKGIDIVKEAKDLNIKNILIQPGAGSDEIYDFCRENNINFEDGCILVQLSQEGK